MKRGKASKWTGITAGVNCKRTLRIGLLTIILLAFAGTGCSIIDPDKTSGLQRLAVWQYKSEGLAKTTSASKQLYNNARDEIRAYIDVTLAAEINDVASKPFGTVDLRVERIPPTVTAAVDEFEASAAGPPTRAITVGGAFIEWVIIEPVLDWAYEKGKESRKASADDLRKMLQNVKWKDWSEIHDSK